MTFRGTNTSVAVASQIALETFRSDRGCGGADRVHPGQRFTESGHGVNIPGNIGVDLPARRCSKW